MQTHRQTDKQKHSSQYSVLYQGRSNKKENGKLYKERTKKIKTKVNIRSILPKISFKMASVDQFKK